MTRLTKFCQAADHLKRGSVTTIDGLAEALEVERNTACVWVRTMQRQGWIEPRGVAESRSKTGGGVRPTGLGVEGMMTLLVCLGAAAVMMLCGYLAACAGAERWLSLGEWWGRTTCGHARGRLVRIEYDGDAVYECAACGKHIRKPLL